MIFLLLTNLLFAHNGPDIDHLETKIKCDESGMMKHKVDVAKSQANTDLQVGFTLEHMAKKFQSSDTIVITQICDGTKTTSRWDVGCSGNSCYISGDKFEAGPSCGTIADFWKFDQEWIDGYGFNHLFLSPPKTIKKSYSVQIDRANMHSEVYRELAKCTMNIVDDPKPETVEETPKEETEVVEETPKEEKPQNSTTTTTVKTSSGTNSSKPQKKATPPKMFHAQVTVSMLPPDTLKQRIKKKGRAKLKKKAAKQGYTKQAGKVLVPKDPDCVIKENKCTAKVKAKFQK